MTWAGFVERVERLAALFAGRGVAEGSTVTIGLPNSIGLVESLFAVWALGAVPQSQAGAWPALESVPRQLPAGSFTPGVSPVWKLVTSGGSTGRPKLIAATGAALFENVGGLSGLIHLPPGGCVLMTGPISHNAPFVATAVGMLLGNHVVLMSRFDPAQTLRLIQRHRASWLYLVPTVMLRIWRLPDAVRPAADISSPQVAFHMAAPCPPWLKQAWIDWLGPEKVLELYGGTELQDLIAHLRQRLAPYKLPRAIERATTPLRDDAGKVRRSALRAERIAQRTATRRTGQTGHLPAALEWIWTRPREGSVSIRAGVLDTEPVAGAPADPLDPVRWPAARRRRVPTWAAGLVLGGWAR